MVFKNISRLAKYGNCGKEKAGRIIKGLYRKEIGFKNA